MLQALDRSRDDPGVSTTEERVEQTDRSRGRRLCCAACGHPITTTAARTSIAGHHLHTFCNPHGLVFEVGCFTEASGCAATGPAEDFFSWFPGYAWRVGICRNCHVHLGWSYGEGPDFWGLIVDRLQERPSED